jgi:hypothetical protein
MYPIISSGIKRFEKFSKSVLTSDEQFSFIDKLALVCFKNRFNVPDVKFFNSGKFWRMTFVIM